MAEITSRDGTWSFDGEVVRIVPGHDRSVHKLRRAVGELAIPLQAVAGVAYEPGKKGGRLRLRLRDGADPFSQAVAGGLRDAADPYKLLVGDDRTGAAEFFVDDVRNSLLVWEVPEGPCDRYLLPGPGVPVTAAAGDGNATFDGEHIRLEWNWYASETKKKAGPQVFALDDLAGVEWIPLAGMGYGRLRFRLRHEVPDLPAVEDPHSLSWGVQRDGGTTSLLAAAVLARLPHPSASDGELSSPALPAVPEPSTAEASEADDEADKLLRRLRELGDLHRDGVLTEGEFSAAKQALLQRFQSGRPRAENAGA